MKILILSTTFLVSLSSGAFAQDNHDHHNHDHATHSQEAGFYGHLDARVYVTDIYDAAEADEEISDSFTHTHMDGGYRFGNGVSINGTALLEGDPAGHSHGGGNAREGDHFFDDHPLFIEELTINYDTDTYGAYVGKFTPAFGADVHYVPGWFGLLNFEEFQVREKLGFGGYAAGEINGIGAQRFEASTFFTDTTFLSESILYDRDTPDHEDGGAGNTEDFASFAAQLSGDTGLQGLEYYLGYMHQGVDQSDEDDENRITFGLNGAFNVSDNVTFRPMMDITDIDHLDGEAAHDRTYSTVGFGVDVNQWVFGGTYTDIHNNADEADENLDGYKTQISVGYNFSHGFGVDLGHQWKKEEGEKSKRLGLLTRYSAEF